MALALLFTFGVVCWLALYAVFASVRWLATGQKPQVLMMWQQMQAMRKGMRTQRSDNRFDVVEDVVVREIQKTE